MDNRKNQCDNLLEALESAGGHGLHTLELVHFCFSRNSRIADLDKNHIIYRRHIPGDQKGYLRYYYIRAKTIFDVQEETRLAAEKRQRLIEAARPIEDPREMAGKLGEIVEHKGRIVFVTRNHACRLDYLAGSLTTVQP